LNEYIEVEELKGDNAYQCSNCNSKQTAQKFVKFKSLPPVLNVQLKRFEYDYNSEQRIKLNDEISFPLKLKMDPYLIDPKLVEEKDFVFESPEYDLVAVLIHSGSAAVGHYYSFLKWENQWFKFNDETVTTADENDIKNQNWSGEKSTFSNFPSWGKSQKSANPYMLVYRKILKTPVTSTNDNDNKSKKQALDASPPILTKDSIPKPILNYLTKRMDERTKRKQDKERESSIVNLTILRNSMEYPVKKLKIEKTATLEQVKQKVIELVEHEFKEPYFYRFRRVANRKNSTKRPMNAYPEEDYKKTLEALQIDKKPHLYLEQSTNSAFPDLDELNEDKCFVQIRFWNKEQRRSNTVRDFVFPKTMLVSDLKKLLSEKYLPNLKPEEMLLFEEETEKNFQLHERGQ